LQGYTMLVGTKFGPLQVVAFTTLRTLTRLPALISGSIGLALRPALSAAFGSGDLVLARNLHRQAFQITLVLALLVGAALLLGGPFAYRVWTGHAVQFDAKCFWVLLAVSTINSLWYTSFAVPTAINRHFSLTAAFLFGNLLALGIGIALAGPFGLFGLTLSLLFAELWMLGIVIPVTVQSLGDNIRSFCSSVLRAPVAVFYAAENWYERRRAEVLSQPRWQ
jgi:O-antigen/teichoic acid export membrane protein